MTGQECFLTHSCPDLFLTKAGRQDILLSDVINKKSFIIYHFEKDVRDMLKDKAYEYFINRDHNCAESALLSISEEYGLDIGPEEMKLVSAFGGGMGCGKLCGVLAGSMAALGRLAVNGRAHATEGFGPLCAELCENCKACLGSTECAELKPLYRNDEVRCLKTVELGLDVFEAYAKEKGLVPAKE